MEGGIHVPNQNLVWMSILMTPHIPLQGCEEVYYSHKEDLWGMQASCQGGLKVAWETGEAVGFGFSCGPRVGEVRVPRRGGDLLGWNFALVLREGEHGLSYWLPRCGARGNVGDMGPQSSQWSIIKRAVKLCITIAVNITFVNQSLDNIPLLYLHCQLSIAVTLRCFLPSFIYFHGTGHNWPDECLCLLFASSSCNCELLSVKLHLSVYCYILSNQTVQGT